MPENNSFLKIAAVSAFITALTTFLLWLLPNLYQAPSSFEEGVLLHQNIFYLSRQWVNFIHIPLAFVSSPKIRTLGYWA